MPDLAQVTPDKVDKVWPRLRERIAYGVEKSDGPATVEGLYEKAKSGEWDLHVVIEDEADDPVRCVFLTQVYDEMDGRRVCAMRFLTGKNRVEWVWLVEALELWALQNGCDRMEMLVRARFPSNGKMRGWVKDLYDYGYRQTHAFLEKDLRAENGQLGQENDGHQHANAA